MANPDYATTLAQFSAIVQKNKNRLVAIPAATWQTLGLERRPGSEILACSIRRTGRGRWNHHYFKLTANDEFSIPTDVADIGPGDRVEVKVHCIKELRSLPPAADATAADVLLDIAASAGIDSRVDGSDRVDDYLFDRHK